MDVKARIYAALDGMGIAYAATRHPLAHTMEDLRAVEARMGCVIPKNLFLTPRNQSAFYLCLARPDAAFRTADISKQIGSSRLSFGPADALDALLHTHPGAVSPMGLALHDAREVGLLIDERLTGEPFLGFHPNDNAETLVMSGADFFGVFLPSVGKTPTYVRF